MGSLSPFNRGVKYLLCIIDVFTKYAWFRTSHPNPGRREKTELNFYFHTSLWRLKRFHEGLKSLHKTF